MILVVFLLRSFLVEPFKIPSGSMLPTLLVGDFILVNKYTYGIRLPVINLKVADVSEPRRGEVMVFRYPVNPSLDYIKRVVGLPGDEVVYRRSADDQLSRSAERMENITMSERTGSSANRETNALSRRLVVLEGRAARWPAVLCTLFFSFCLFLLFFRVFFFFCPLLPFFSVFCFFSPFMRRLQVR